MIKFEAVSRLPDAVLPIRKTAQSAGYDFTVAEDIVIPPYNNLFAKLNNYTISDAKDIFKSFLETLQTRPFQFDNSHIILPLGFPSKIHIWIVLLKLILSPSYVHLFNLFFAVLIEAINNMRSVEQVLSIDL